MGQIFKKVYINLTLGKKFSIILVCLSDICRFKRREVISRAQQKIGGLNYVQKKFFQ